MGGGRLRPRHRRCASVMSLPQLLMVGFCRKHKHSIYLGSLSRKLTRTCKTITISHSLMKALIVTRQILFQVFLRDHQRLRRS